MGYIPFNNILEILFAPLMQMASAELTVIFPELEEEVWNYAHELHNEWKMFAMGHLTINGVQLHPQTGAYARGVRDPQVIQDRAQYTIRLENTCPYSEAIEHGIRQNFSLADKIMDMKHRKVSKTGSLYVVVPFNHKWKDMSMFAQTMWRGAARGRQTRGDERSTVYREVVRHAMQRGTAKGSILQSKNSYRWGRRHTVIPGTIPAKPHHKTPKEQNMYRFDMKASDKKAKLGFSVKSYMTFRTLSTAGKNRWVIPYRPPANIGPFLTFQARKELPPRVEAALARDMDAYMKEAKSKAHGANTTTV
jgi:hypothetical protein